MRLDRALAGAPRAGIGLAIVAAMVALAWIGAQRVPLLSTLEALAYDARLAIAPRAPADPKVVIVDIDEASLARIGRWPWPRDKLARLTTQLVDRHQARLVAFDVLFAEPDLSGNAAGLRELARTRVARRRRHARRARRGDFARRPRRAVRGRARRGARPCSPSGSSAPRFPPACCRRRRSPQASIAPNAIPIAPEAGYTGNLPEFARAATTAGHLDPWFDRDGVVRRVPMVKRHGDAFYPALSLAVAALAVDAKAHPPGVRRERRPRGLRRRRARGAGVARGPRARALPRARRELPQLRGRGHPRGAHRAGRVRRRDRARRHQRQGPAGPALDAARAGLSRRRDPREPRLRHARRRTEERARGRARARGDDARRRGARRRLPRAVAPAARRGGRDGRDRRGDRRGEPVAVDATGRGRAARAGARDARRARGAQPGRRLPARGAPGAPDRRDVRRVRAARARQADARERPALHAREREPGTHGPLLRHPRLHLDVRAPVAARSRGAAQRVPVGR